MIFKMVSGLLDIQLPPYFLHKGDGALGNSILKKLFKLVPKQANTNTVLLRVQSKNGTLYQTESLKSGQWKLSKRLSCAMFKKR